MPAPRGFSLVEALIALALLALGTLSVGAMQLKALESASAGYQRSLASVAAVDAQERVWAALSQAGDCHAISLAAVETVWREYWFADQPQAALSALEAGQATISGSGCQATVTVALPPRGGVAVDPLVYRFRLPSGL